MTQNNHDTSELEKYKRQLSLLKRENEELLRNLHEVNQKLHDSEQLKGHFISNITNEIINPFTSIMALAQTIKQLDANDMEKAHKMASLIYEEAFHLDFQLKNIFSAAMIEAGKDDIKCSLIDLQDFSRKIGAYFDPLLEKKQISLRVIFSGSEPLAFTTDKEKLELIVKNLVSNSLKYSPEHSEVELRFLLSGATLVVEVSDNGKGIQHEDRKIVFDRFRQLDEKINSINTGHGLGLSIVLAYAEMLGGKVDIDDNGGGGIKVSVYLPECSVSDEWDELDDFIFDSDSNY